jgi:hypothetical protein
MGVQLGQTQPQGSLMHHTPWTKPGSAVPPVRTRPSSTQRNANSKAKGKSKEPPKSAEVQKLEALVDACRRSSGKGEDPKGGCFCQGALKI